jgi:hypothetical protein
MQSAKENCYQKTQERDVWRKFRNGDQFCQPIARGNSSRTTVARHESMTGSWNRAGSK